MGTGFLAEASPCCPSPIFGELVVVAYIVGGAALYIWIGSMLFRWAHGRFRQRGSSPERTP
jgi:hypothetical protein